MTDLGVDERLDQRTDERLEPGDHERLAHIIRKSDHMKAYVMGEEVVALCGKKWVPSRDPEKFPVCPECRSMLEALSGARGGGDRR
ncbi:MAG: DUF3039 domain-containing protein [Acidimicrobiia bacterium]|nr:DUF3039 domain-containing protein [Acidimicrobiia bacterium]